MERSSSSSFRTISRCICRTASIPTSWTQVIRVRTSCPCSFCGLTSEALPSSRPVPMSMSDTTTVVVPMSTAAAKTPSSPSFPSGSAVRNSPSWVRTEKRVSSEGRRRRTARGTSSRPAAPARRSSSERGASRDAGSRTTLSRRRGGSKTKSGTNPSVRIGWPFSCASKSWTSRSASGRTKQARRTPSARSFSERKRRSPSETGPAPPPRTRTLHLPHVPRPPQAALIDSPTPRSAVRSVSPGTTERERSCFELSLRVSSMSGSLIPFLNHS